MALQQDKSLAQAWSDGLGVIQNTLDIGSGNTHLKQGYYYDFCWNNARIEIMSQNNAGVINSDIISQCNSLMQNQCINNNIGGLCIFDNISIRMTQCNVNPVCLLGVLFVDNHKPREWTEFLTGYCIRSPPLSVHRMLSHRPTIPLKHLVTGFLAFRATFNWVTRIML
jgi:hypothetical protein